MTTPCARRPADESGTILVLVAGLVALTLLLVAAVTDAATVFLARRSLAATADACAVRAAQAISAEALYAQAPTDDVLPVATRAAAAAVDAYLADSAADEQQPRVVEVSAQNGVVTVVLTTSTHPPLSRWLLADPGGVVLTAEATASTEVTP